MPGIPELSGGRSLNHPAAFGAGVQDQTGDGVNVATLTGNVTLLGPSSAKFQKLNPGGSNRDVILPAEEISEGLSYRITNAAAGANNLIIKDDAAATIVTLNQNEATWVVCSGSAWVHMGVETIALV
jgi:hypothetical protein